MIEIHPFKPKDLSKQKAINEIETKYMVELADIKRRLDKLEKWKDAE